MPFEEGEMSKFATSSPPPSLFVSLSLLLPFFQSKLNLFRAKSNSHLYNISDECMSREQRICGSACHTYHLIRQNKLTSEESFRQIRNVEIFLVWHIINVSMIREHSE